MAHIKKMTDKPRTLPWRAHVHRKGHKPIVKMFKTERDAERWGAEQERSMTLVGLPLTFEELKKHTVGDLVRRYLKEKTPHKGCVVSEATVLKKFLRRDICLLPLASAKKADGHKYVSNRLAETWRGNPITPRTVRRELNTLAHIFEVAREEWGFENLINPFRIRIKGSTYRRKRRLNQGELEALERASADCRGQNYFYVPLAIYLAIETGMRLQEIFNLTWQDVDLENRRIEIRRSKSDDTREHAGRTIVLPLIALFYLTRIIIALQKDNRFYLTKTIFPMTGAAFQQSWADVIKRAGIVDLHFHDLRHEAASRMDAMGLTGSERDLMMGHVNKSISSLYVHADLKSIQDKLDRHFLNGRTLDEGKHLADIKFEDLVAQQAREGKIPVERAKYLIANVLLDMEGKALLTAKQRAKYFRTHLRDRSRALLSKKGAAAHRPFGLGRK
jgi:integrase